MLAQTKYLERHNNALKILFCEVLRSVDLIDTEEPWYSRINPKPMYERASAYWDGPLYAENDLVSANRIDATIVDKGKREVSLIEMSCPCIENREVKAEEKTTKYAPLRVELKERYPGYQVTQYIIIIDVLGGYSREVKQALKKLVGDRSNSLVFKMQKSVLSSSLRYKANRTCILRFLWHESILTPYCVGSF